MRRLHLLPALALLAFPAFAETIAVTAADCGHVVAHAPDPSVAYRPGVTADGRAVAPAELAGGYAVRPPEKIVIDIKVDLQKRLGIPADASQYIGEAQLGQVVVENGRAFYNGQELATGAQNAVAAACRELRAKKR